MWLKVYRHLRAITKAIEDCYDVSDTPPRKTEPRPERRAA
jgi:hypothetical protein